MKEWAEHRQFKYTTMIYEWDMCSSEWNMTCECSNKLKLGCLNSLPVLASLFNQIGLLPETSEK